MTPACEWVLSHIRRDVRRNLIEELVCVVVIYTAVGAFLVALFSGASL